MIIYVEGADGSGKSTLVDMLSCELSNMYKVDSSANLRIPTHPKDDNRVDEKTLFKELTKMAKDNVIHILDRGPISDCVYRVFDEHKAVTNMNKVSLFLKKNNRRVFTIYCNTKHAKQKMLERGDENPIAINRHDEISKVFKNVMDTLKTELPFNYCEYDFMSKGLGVNRLIGEVTYFCYMAIVEKR